MYVYIHIYINIFTETYTCEHENVYMYISICTMRLDIIHTHVKHIKNSCTCTRTYILMHIKNSCTCTRTYILMHIKHTCTYIHTQTCATANKGAPFGEDEYAFMAMRVAAPRYHV